MLSFNQFIKESKIKLVEIKPNRFVYHVSNPIFRENINKEGLKPKGKSETWLSDTPIDGEVIFASNSDKKQQWFDSTYDDDIYQIDTTKINNKWYEDPNFGGADRTFWFAGKKHKLPKNHERYYHIITYEPIPLDALKLIHKGTGKSKI